MVAGADNTSPELWACEVFLQATATLFDEVRVSTAAKALARHCGRTVASLRRRTKLMEGRDTGGLVSGLRTFDLRQYVIAMVIVKDLAREPDRQFSEPLQVLEGVPAGAG
jgi:hypothetical protein